MDFYFSKRTRAAKFGRLKAYALDSVQFTLSMTVVYAAINFDNAASCILGILGECAVYFVVFFVLDYMIYDGKSKRYYKEHQNVEQ